MKLYLILIILMLTSCAPASKKALERTNQDLVKLAEAYERLAGTVGLHAELFDKYVEMPPEVKQAVLQDGKNRVVEAKAVKEIIIEDSKKEVGIFSKGQFMYFVTQFYDVAKPVLKDIAKAVVEVGSSQGGIIGTITSGLLLAYGVYQQVSKSSVISKIEIEKKEAKEIEHEADKLIPTERHAEWDDAVSKAKVKVLAKKKGLA